MVIYSYTRKLSSQGDKKRKRKKKGGDKDKTKTKQFVDVYAYLEHGTDA